MHILSGFDFFHINHLLQTFENFQVRLPPICGFKFKTENTMKVECHIIFYSKEDGEK